MGCSKILAVTISLAALSIEGNVLKEADTGFTCPDNCRCQAEEIFCPNLADVSLDSLPKGRETLVLTEEVSCTDEKVITLLRMSEKNSLKLRGLCYDSISSTKKQLRELVEGGTYKDFSIQHEMPIHPRIKRSGHPVHYKRSSSELPSAGDENFSPSMGIYSSPAVHRDKSKSGISIIIPMALLVLIITATFLYATNFLKRRKRSSSTTVNFSSLTSSGGDTLPPSNGNTPARPATSSGQDQDSTRGNIVTSSLNAGDEQNRETSPTISLPQGSERLTITYQIQEREVLPDYDSLAQR